ncbi:MAG: hypothetical protein VKO21_04955 [Candidatus Sericytochromatia bacterium]|nr:hypothetical protein [Candidatus Sericytochromatia bacterium]
MEPIRPLPSPPLAWLLGVALTTGTVPAHAIETETAGATASVDRPLQEQMLPASLALTAAGSGLFLATLGANPIQTLLAPMTLGVAARVTGSDWRGAALSPLGALAGAAVGGALGLGLVAPLRAGRAAGLSTDLGADSLEWGVLLGMAAWHVWEAIDLVHGRTEP